MSNLFQRLTVQRWLHDLHSGQWPARARAAEKLGELRDPRAVEALTAALAGHKLASGVTLALGANTEAGISEEQDRFLVRQAAAKALGQIGDSNAVPALIGALEDVVPAVQIEAVRALGLLRDPRAIEPLVAMLRSHDPEVRAETVKAIAGFGTTPVEWLVELLRHAAFDTRQAAARTLGLIGGPVAIQALAEAMRDPDFQVRREAIEALAGQGRPAVAPLLPLLQDTDEAAREATVKALGKIRDASALEPLKAMVADPQPAIRAAAWHALALLDWPPARERERVQRILAAGDYARVVLAGSAAVGPLLEAYRQAGKTAREKIAHALAEIGPAGTEGLLVYLQDRDRDVRRLAALVLQQYGWTPRSSEQRVWLAVATGHFEAAVAEGATAIPSLNLLCTTADEWERQLAVESLGKIGGPNVIQPLAEALGDSAARVRLAAVRALSQAGGEAATQALRTALKDGDYNVRQAAQEALNIRGQS